MRVGVAVGTSVDVGTGVDVGGTGVRVAVGTGVDVGGTDVGVSVGTGTVVGMPTKVRVKTSSNAPPSNVSTLEDLKPSK